MTEQYVCAFRGRRDSYQVPLALAETGRLDQFITDIYTPPWLRSSTRFFPPSLRAKLNYRFEPGIPSEKVDCLWIATAREHLRHQLGYGRMDTFLKLDSLYAQAAAQRARKTRSHLLLYSSYALEAFQARYAHTPRKVLFQYHPHPGLERRLLDEDARQYPELGESSALKQTNPLEQREYEAWKYADLIFCASTFTKRSLLEAGADGKKICVVPYGMETSPASLDIPANEAFNIVFVGTGLKRKGLHHLLLAWKRASLPPSSKLTLICRMIDPSLEPLIADTPRVELIRGVSGPMLNQIYSTSSLFVMPSIVEGFGQVYLEALAHGCPVLGTANTALPDLGGEADGIYLVEPGHIDELSSMLERLSRLLPSNHKIRQAARDGARRYTWEFFRTRLIQKLGHPSPSTD